MKTRLWIVGQIKGEYRESGSIWEFQGVFSDEVKADKACKDENYFYYSVRLNVEFSRNSIEPKDSRYPRCREDAK